MRGAAAVGREVELAEIGLFLAALPEGSQGLSLRGEPGIGKTTLWQAAVEEATGLGYPVLTCRPAETEAKLSFAGLSDMLESVGDEDLAALPALQHHALSVALLRTAPAGPAPDPRLVATAFLGLLRHLAGRGPILLAVDDAQWLDGPTATALAFAFRRLTTEPVGLMCALRPSQHGLGPLETVERDRITRVEIVGLGLPELGRMIEDRLRRAMPRPTLVRIAEVSRGNPFHALEVARLVPAHDGGEDGGPLPVPDDVRMLAASRVAALPEVTRAALLRAAVLAGPDIRMIDPDALAAAEAVDVVRIDDRGRITFTHPLFAAAIYASASEAERREAQRAAAAGVLDPEQRARHLAHSVAAPDPHVATELDAAAELACLRGAPGAGAELMELALLHTPPADHLTRTQRLTRAAEIHFDGGGLRRATELVDALLAADPPEALRAHGLRLRASLQWRTDGFAAAMVTAREALAAAASDPSIAAAIELEIAFYLVGLGDVGGALQHAQAASGRASLPGGDPGVVGDALAVVTMVSFLNGDGIAHERLARALELEDRGHRRPIFTSPRFIAGLLQMWTGDLDTAVRTLTELRAERIERGADSDIPTFSLYLVWAYLWQGDSERAARLVDEDLAAVALLADRGLEALALSAAALVSAHRGDVELARERSDQALESFTALSWWTGTVWPRWAKGFAELSVGDAAAAHAALGPLTEALPSLGLADPVGIVFVPDEIDALVALGELDSAQALITLLARLGDAHDRPWAIAAAARGRGVRHAARGELDDAIAAFADALVAHDRAGMPFERARTLLALGRVLRRRKQWSQTRETLREAAETFERTGALRWAGLARNELARAGERTSDPSELTPTERRVAELAASGLTNQEVAERAYLSVKGVEANLTRAYRKLGIRSRTGLSAALGAGEEPVA